MADLLSILPMHEAPLADRERADARRNRERIVCAVRALVAEHGIDGVSMDAVAARAGVGKGTLYRRFGDRAGLLRALIEEPERALQEALIRGAPPLGPGAPALARLRAFGGALIEHLECNSGLICAGERGDAGRLGHPVYSVYRAHIAILLEELLGAGPRTDYFVDVLLAPLGADMFRHLRERRAMSVREITDGWCSLLDSLTASGPG